MSDDVNRRRPRDVHRDDVALAHRYRLSVSSPRQSSFRVVAVIYYRSTSSSRDDRDQEENDEAGDDEIERHVVGTNDEPCHIGGSLCAERAAMLRLRFLPDVTVVTRIVIVTDAPHEITPGPMCREFLASSTAVPWDVPVVLGGSACRHCGADFGNVGDSCSVECDSASEGGVVGGRHDFVYRVETVRSLYPNPSPYVRLTSREAVAFGERFASTAASSSGAGAEADETPGGTVGEDHESSSDHMFKMGGDSSDVECDASLQRQRLVDAAALASLGDDRDDVHPIRYGAAVLFSDGSVSTARQVKGLEYGCTLDAVGQLAPVIRERSSGGRGRGRGGGTASAPAAASSAVVRPVMLAQADQFGIAHAPFAPGRAYLSEHGFGDCWVVVHEFHDVGDNDDDDRVVAADASRRGGGAGDRSSIPQPRLVRVRADGLVPGAPRMGGGVLLREA